MERETSTCMVGGRLENRLTRATVLEWNKINIIWLYLGVWHYTLNSWKSFSGRKIAVLHECYTFLRIPSKNFLLVQVLKKLNCVDIPTLNWLVVSLVWSWASAHCMLIAVQVQVQVHELPLESVEHRGALYSSDSDFSSDSFFPLINLNVSLFLDWTGLDCAMTSW